MYVRFMGATQAILLIFVITLSQASHTVQHYLTQNLNNLLGADLVISQQGALRKDQLEMLKSESHKLVLTQSLTTTLTHHKHWQQATLKAVGDDYPLLGTLRVSTARSAEDEAITRGPQVGEIWLDARLIASLSIDVGGTIMIAQRSFKVARILHHEPDRLMEGHNMHMRAMVHSNDFRELNIPADTIQHRYLLSASRDQVTRLRAWQKVHAPAAELYHRQGAHPLALFWKRTENFIGLSSIVLFFMAAIAIQQLTHVQLKREQHVAAVIQSLGASGRTLMFVSGMKWCLQWIFLLPGVLVASVFCYGLILHWLGQSFMGLTWTWHVGVFIKAVLATTMIFAVLQLPTWLGIKQSSVAQLIQNTHSTVNHAVMMICVCVVLTGVAATYSDNALLTASVLGAMAACIVLILLMSWITLSLGEKLTGHLSGLIPFALYMMKQRLLSKSTQILGVGLCAFLLLFTLMLLKDVGDSMASYQRQHDGNLLVSQASVEQMADVVSWVETHGAQIRQQKPFMYAKLTQINGLDLTEFTQRPSESMASFSRPIRLHWTGELPANNRKVAGTWWQANDPNWQQVSLEQEVMTDLGLQLGDRLSFFIAGQIQEFDIVASHAYAPGAGSITFWVQMPPAALQQIEAPHYTMASIELSEEQFSLLDSLWQKHPSLRMVSLQEMTSRFDRTLAMVTQVVSGFSILIIALSIMVILVSVYALESKEKKKNSIIMSFGLSRGTCWQLNIIEWLVTGGIAAVGAIVGTWLAGLLIYQSQFSMPYRPDPTWLLATLSIIVFAVTTLGIAASRNSLSSSIRELMAE